MKQIIFFCMSISILSVSCTPKRNLVYFSNISTQVPLSTTTASPVVIQVNDVVSITVNSQNIESNRQFLGYRNQMAEGAQKKEGYRVSIAGKVQLPFIGDYPIANLTIEQAQTNIAAALASQMRNPVVDIQLLNFRVTVIGEVNKPGAFVIDNNQINLLEALGMAGDLTPYGKRENIMLIRNENGLKTVNRINLNDKSALSSPYFALKQNDIIYIEPDQSKAFETSKSSRTIPLIIASISALAVLAAVIVNQL